MENLTGGTPPVRYLPCVVPCKLYFPIVFYFVNRRYVWCSILLTVLIELIINWGNFNYYESRGLMILVTLVQIAVMAIIILILKAVASKRKK